MAARNAVGLGFLACLCLVAGSARAQNAGEAAKAEPKAETNAGGTANGERELRPDPRLVVTAMLRVQIVISRYEHDKKQASLPYTFVVGASRSGTQHGVRMRMGIETPVPTIRLDESGKAKSTGMIQYRNVGTNIDCRAGDLGDGRYELSLSVENSSALTASPGAATPEEIGGAPLFRTFNTFFDPVLRDGQTIETVASTDPVTGEVVKLDVTMHVLK